MLLIVNSCFLLLVRVFDKLPAFKTNKEKMATSLKIKHFMPKISEIVLKNKKRLIFLVSILLFQFGGADESRTRYPLRAKQMLSQLSYSPICRRLCIISNLFKKKRVIFIKVKNIAL